MADQVSQRYLFIDIGGGASKELKQVKSIDVKDGNSTDVTVSIGGHKGFRDKIGGFEIDLSVYREIGRAPEVDWLQLKANRTTFTVTSQDEFGGRRIAYTCRVSKVDDKGDAEGMHEDTVTLAATYRYPGFA